MNRGEQEAEAAVLRAEYPQWEAWRGIDGLWHARWPEHYDPEGRPVMVWGEDPTDLRDQMRREIGRAEQGLVTDAGTRAQPRPGLATEDGPGE